MLGIPAEFGKVAWKIVVIKKMARDPDEFGKVAKNGSKLKDYIKNTVNIKKLLKKT